MPRKNVPIIPNLPYHITARRTNREWFAIPTHDVWSIMEDMLYLMSIMFEIRIHSFVLMSNHFHLLVTAPEGNLSQALLYFLRETSKAMNRQSGRTDQNYGRRNHKTLIIEYLHFMNTYKYVYRNPVRAGLCQRVEEYPYSTLNGILGLSKLVIPVVEDTILFNPRFDQSALDWLNTSPTADREREMRLALRRPVFELKTSRHNGKPSPLTQELL